MQRSFCGWVCMSVAAFALGCGGTSLESAPSSNGSSKAATPSTIPASRPAKVVAKRPAKAVAKVVAKNWVYTALEVAASAYQWTLESVHDGTGWLLGKAEVSIDQVGELRPIGDDKFVADFIIKVHSGDKAFTTTIKDVPCTEMAIPSEGWQEKFNEAVQKIKTMLANLDG